MRSVHLTDCVITVRLRATEPMGSSTILNGEPRLQANSRLLVIDVVFFGSFECNEPEPVNVAVV